MRKILLQFVIVCLAAILLVGCGGTTDKNVELEGDGDIVYDDNGNVVYDNIKLKMWSVTTGDDAKTQDSIVAGFNEMYKGLIEVEVVHYSRYDLESLMSNTMQMDQENAPDLLFNHGSRVTEYNDRGWLQQVDFFFEKSGALFDKQDFVPSLLESVTIDDVAYGMPIDCHSTVLCIREDILKKNGLEIPTTYEELCEVCDQAAKLAAENNLWIRGENTNGFKPTEWRKATTQEAYTAFPMCFGDMWVHEFVGYTAAIQNGAEIVKADGLPAWNTQEAANGITLLKEMFFPTAESTNKSPLSKDYSSSYDVGDAPFLKGDCIFKLQGPWAWQKEMENFDLLLGTDGGNENITTRSISGLFAKDSTKDYASNIKGEGHAITLMKTVKSYTKACAATLFMEYMATSSGIEWAKRGHLPAVRSVQASADYTSNEAYDKYIKYWGTPEDYVVVPPTKYYSYVDTYFKNSVQQALATSYKDTPVNELLDKHYKDCVDYIQLYQ